MNELFAKEKARSEGDASWWEFRGRMEARLKTLETLVQDQAAVIDDLRTRVCTCGELGSRGSPIEVFDDDDEEGEGRASLEAVGSGSVSGSGSGSYVTPPMSERPLPVVIRRRCPLIERINTQMVMMRDEYNRYLEELDDPAETFDPSIDP